MKIKLQENKYIIPAIYINGFFTIGILSALSIRLIIVFQHINAEMVRPIWYVGVIGYTVFFAYRFYITRKRRRLILQHDLLNKIGANNEINTEDKELLEYLVISILKSKEYLNYLFIFTTSLLAIVVDLLLRAYMGN